MKTRRQVNNLLIVLLVLVAIAVGAILSNGVRRAKAKEAAPSAPISPLPTATCTAPPSGMVSWWPGDGNANDIQGTNNGTTQNGVTFPAGKVSQAFYQNAGNQGTLIGNPANLQLQDFTIDAWIKRDDATKVEISPDNPFQLASIFSYGSDGYGFGIFPDGRLVLSKIGVDDVRTTALLVNDTSFHHVAVTKTGSTVVFYVDGVSESVGAYNPGFTFSSNAYIGYFGSGGGSFLGALDEVQVFNVALSQTDIQNIYNAGSAGVCKPGGKTDQTITFGTLADKTFGDGDFAVSATASSGLSVSFAASGHCTISSSTVHLTGAGSCTITASQAGDSTYNAAPDVQRSFNIAKATPTITWNNPSNIVYGTALGGTQLNAMASVPGGFVYTPSAGAVLHAGNNQTLHVDFTPTDTTNYSAMSKDVSINVTKATLTITANDKTKSYRAANPIFTYTPTGFVNGDTTTVLSGAPTLTTTAVTTSNVGGYPITVAQNTLAASDYMFNLVNGTLTVTKATPTISWSNPSDITYGTALGSTQLNATATNPNDSSSVAGTFTYNPTSGTVLHAGNAQTLHVDFAPTDTANYSTPAQKTVSINVLKATLTVTADDKTKSYRAANPPLAYTLSGFVNSDTASVLSGTPSLSTTAITTSIAGGYPINIAQGTLSAADYTFNFVGGTLTVMKATPVISWSNPADIVFGTALGAAQLNATASNPNDGASIVGNFVYNPAASTVLNAGNNQTLAVNFTPAGTDASSYNTPAQKTVAINVLKADQTITFNPLSDKTFGDAPFAVSATASSGLSVSFAASGQCTVAGSTVHITGAGSCTITASQGGNSNFSAAANVLQTFSIAKADQTITFGSLANKVIGATPFNVSASATSALPVSFSIISGPATISGNTVTITGAGTVTVRVTQTGNSNYNAAPNVDQSFIVTSTPATPINGQFVFWIGGSGIVTTASADGKVINQLQSGINPAWSPDGTKIVFSHLWSNSAGANPHLSIMNQAWYWTPRGADGVQILTYQ